jgi:hypothetical protein
MKKIWWSVRFFLSLLLLYLLYSRLDLNKCIVSMKELGIRSIAAYASSWVGVMLLPSVAIWRLACLEKRMPLKKFVAITHVNRLYSLAMPLIVATGARFAQYIDAGLSKKHSAVLLATNRSLNMFAVLAGSFAAAIILNCRMQNRYFRLTICLSAICLAFMIYSCWLLKRLSSKTDSFQSPIMLKLVTLVEATMSLSPARVAAATGFILLGHLFVVLSQWLLLCDLGQRIGFIEILWSRSLVSLLLMLPVSVAGLGFRDVGLVTTLAVFGVSTPIAVSLALTLLAFQVVHGMIGFVMEQAALIRAGQGKPARA